MKLKLAASVLVLGLATLLGACQTGGDTTIPGEDPAADPNAPMPEEPMPGADPTAPEGAGDPMAPEGQEPPAAPEG